jgi:pentatricopeptide repeat protein
MSLSTSETSSSDDQPQQAIDAWAKSGAKGGAQRAQHIHDGMIEMYRQSGDPQIAPSSISYNAVMNAWGKCSDPSSPEMAEKVLEDMLEWDSDHVKTDAITFSTLMDTYARSNRTDSARRAEELFESMDELGVKRNVFTFSALQNVYARSGQPNAPKLSMKVLHRMLELSSNGDMFAKPNCGNYNAVLNAYSRTPCRESALQAAAMLTLMETPVEEGGFDVEPDRLSYALTILACSRCPDASFGARISEANLEKMEARARIEAQKREEVSSAAPPSVSLDIECFNVVLTAISRSRQSNATDRMIEIITRMEEYAKAGLNYVRPNVRSWNAVLNCLSRSKEEGAAEKAEQILNHVFELHENGVPHVKPDAFSFAAVLAAYQRLGTPAAIRRADDIVRHMEDLYKAGDIDEHPDVYHYTIVCAAWARSYLKEAPGRCVEILSHMKERHKAGHSAVRPNVRTYNACLDCLSRAHDADKAEQLLYHMLALSRNGENDAKPDSFSFNTVINAFTRSQQKDAGRRAESVLDRFLEYSEEFPNVRPDVRSFTHIIAYYSRNKEMLDAPYRAEYVLNRMVSMFKSGQYASLSPNVFAVTTVMDSYSLHRHPDAGDCAERLLRLMIKLRDNFGADKLEVNTGVMNSVLNAWASCGDDDAGRRADVILRDMEQRCELGAWDLRPNARSYCLVLSAWTKSASFDKAERALEVLERMKLRHAEDKLHVKPGEHPYSLVINACAFTSASLDAESSAFKIAVKTMTEMTDSPLLEPSSVTYGWFIQACDRLRVPSKVKEENLERAFQTCCDMGRVNDFVLNKFRGAASDALFRRMLSPAIAKVGSYGRGSEDLKHRVQLSHLPREWTRKRRQTRRDFNGGSRLKPSS